MPYYLKNITVSFLEQNNPQALEEMAERLLEACQRSMWQDNQDYTDRLQDLLLDLDQQAKTRKLSHHIMNN